MRARALAYAALTLLGTLAVLGCSPHQADARGVRLKLLGHFSSPTYLAAPRGDRQRRFVVQRAGKIVVVKDGHKLTTPFLNISSDVRTDGEAGLLSMAFAPDYSQSGLFYVFYVAKNGYLHIEEFKRSSNPDRASLGSRRVVLVQPHLHNNHKGGQLQFGPDGMLYAGLGDGGSEGDPDRNGQKRTTLLAKLIRIDPRHGTRYAIPKDNPFRGRSGIRPEIYAYGLRNPFRFSFDRLKGGLVIGDVGQDRFEEVDYVRNTRGRGKAPRGGYNFGWSVFEGRSHYNSGSAPHAIGPVIQHSHSGGYCSVIGGYVIRDKSLGKRLYGKYVYGDLCNSRLRVAALRPGRVRADRTLGPKVSQLDSFGEDGIGRVYAISLGGAVYRLAPR
jgi:hypothetical protein